MKVIDLLNKIAKGEEVPKKIKYKNDTYIFFEDACCKEVKYRNEKFDDISKYLVNKGICNYRIFEPMEDLKEVEMIHLENDVRVLEKENQEYRKKYENAVADYEYEKSKNQRAIEYIKENSFGVSYMEISYLLEILKGDNKED